jgi:enoyl-CoA hydratase/carnithine racemase
MEARDYRKIIVATEASICTITLNNPERRNAIGPEMINELRWALADAEKDDAVRVVVLTGAGKAFCAGADFAAITGGETGALQPFDGDGGDYAKFLPTMCSFGKPIIAKVNGHAMGGGLGLVASSTFALASSGAQLGTPEVDVGLFPMMIMAVLTRLVPRRRLVQMMLLGERIDAKEALSIGLLNSVHAPEELDAKVTELATTLSKKAPLAMKHGLDALYQQDTKRIEESLPMLREKLGVLLGTEDAREGLMAFMQKRTPEWHGR